MDYDTSDVDSVQTESEEDFSPEDSSTFYVGTIDTNDVDNDNYQLPFQLLKKKNH